MKTLAVIALSLATAISSVSSATAFPGVHTNLPQATDIQRVQFQYERGEQSKLRALHNDCNYRYCGDRYDRRGYYHDRRSYYRDRYRRHHRRDSNAGAIIGGLAAGAIIGGLLSQPRYSNRRAYGGNSHTRWCYARYRSYRAWDNTYQPYNGPRRPCYSPY